VIVMRYGYARVPLAEIGADVLLDAFAELPAALARLGA
jgi:phosphoglycolate phosphatase